MAISTLAVVPHYNQAETLPNTLRSLTGQGYDNVIIIDDASRPDQLEEAEYYAGTINATLFRGDENRGAAGNRNRIIETACYLGTNLHFVDADVTINSENTADRVNEALVDNEVGMGGGLVRNPDGTQMAWNHGPSFTLKAHLGGLVQLKLAEMAKTNPETATRWRDRLKFLVDGWPDTADIQAAKPFWVAEANMFIGAKTLHDVGGFPPVRHHDVQGPAIELARRGLRTVFEPGIDGMHYPIGEHAGRNMHIAKATGYLARRYGLKRFLFGGDRAI